MSHDYTGNPAITIVSPPTFSHISDGDDLDEGHLTPAHEQEADYIAALLQGKQDTQTYTKWFSGWQYSVDQSAHAAQWVRYQNGSGHWQNVVNPATNFGFLENQIDMPLHLPAGCTLTALDVFMMGGSGHTLLFTKPSVLLVRSLPTLSSSPTTLITVQDQSIDFTSYEAWHSINVSDHSTPALTPLVVDPLYLYSLVYFPESGSNTHPGTILGPVRATFTTSQLDRRAA